MCSEEYTNFWIISLLKIITDFAHYQKSKFWVVSYKIRVYVQYSNDFFEVHWKREMKSAGLWAQSFLI